MARCNNCGSNDADVDWGLCYECWCIENENTGGSLSRVAASIERSMGNHNQAEKTLRYADKLTFINNLKERIIRDDKFYEKIKNEYGGII